MARGLTFRYLLIGIVAALLGLALPVSRALADEIITLDFTTSDHGCSVIPLVVGYNYGSYVPGTGFVASHADDSHTRWRVNCPSLIYENVYSITFQWNTLDLGNIVTLRAVNNSIVVSCWVFSSCAGQYLTFVNSAAVGGGSYQHSFVFLGGDVDLSSLDMYEDWGFHSDAALQSIIIYTHNDCTEDCEPPLGTLTRPLTSEDEIDTSPLYDQTIIANLATTNLQDYQVYPVLYQGGYQTVSAWSKTPGAKVHAADSGSIVSIHPLAWDDCGIAFVSPSSLDPEAEQTVVNTAFQAEQNQPCLVRQFEFTEDDHPDYSEVAKEEYWLDATDVYIVTLQIGEGSKIQYLVRNAPQYVVVGDTVDAGCVLGETIPLTTTPSQAVNFSGISKVSAVVGVFTGGTLSFVAGAIAVVTDLVGFFSEASTPANSPSGYVAATLYDTEDEIQDLASQLAIEPTSDDHCNATGDFKDCLAFNPQFARNGDGWIASGNVEWTEPGVILDPGESVNAIINLSSTGDYTATAYAQGVDGAPSQIRLFLGSHTERYPAPLEWTSLQLAAEPIGEPDAGTFYTVGVQNVGTAPIEVRSLCVTDGAPNLGRNSCYFNNYSFVQGTSGWDVSEGVEVADEALNVPDDGVISQNVMLNPLPGGPATYKLVVRGDWWYTGELDTVSSASAIAQVQYEWPDGTGYQNMVPVTIKANLAYGGGRLAYIANIEVSETTDDVMNIKVSTTTAGDMDVQGIRITDACLSTIDGGGFPGQGGGGAPPPLNANCEYVSRPQNNDPAAWLQWHWAMSNQFFRCDLLVLLNKMYKLGQQSYTLAGWQARYMQSSMRMYSSWLGSQFFPYLNGQFANVVRGLGNATSGASETFDSSANIITDAIQAAQMISNAIKGIVSIVRTTIEQFLSFFHLMTDIINAIVGAYNDTQAIPIPYLPQCTLGPDESVICIGIWVVDNTVLAGPGAALIPILVTFGCAHLFLWLAGEIKRVIIQQGQAI